MSSTDIKLTIEDAGCPFCGANGGEMMCIMEDGEWAVGCTRCGASGPPMKDPADAIDEWNHRAVQSEPEPP